MEERVMSLRNVCHVYDCIGQERVSLTIADERALCKVYGCIGNWKNVVNSSREIFRYEKKKYIPSSKEFAVTIIVISYKENEIGEIGSRKIEKKFKEFILFLLLFDIFYIMLIIHLFL